MNTDYFCSSAGQSVTSRSDALPWASSGETAMANYLPSGLTSHASVYTDVVMIG